MKTGSPGCRVFTCSRYAITSPRYCDHVSMCPRGPSDLPCPLRSNAQTAKPPAVRPSTTEEYLPECSLIPCTSATTARGCTGGAQHLPRSEMPSTPEKLNSVSWGDCMRTTFKGAGRPCDRENYAFFS